MNDIKNPQKIIQYNGEVQYNQKITYKVIDAGEDIFIVKEKIKNKITHRSGLYDINEQDSEFERDMILVGDEYRKMIANQDYIKSNLLLFTPYMREKLLNFGMPIAFFDKNFSKKIETLSKNFFNVFAKGMATLDDLVIMDISKYELFDRHGEHLPLGQRFNYSRGGFDNRHYDIERAAEHLLKRQDIVIKPNTRQRLKGWDDNQGDLEKAVTVAESLSEINYNSNELYIDFMWRPSVEDYRKVKNGNPSWDIPRAVFEYDILGLRAAGIALYKDYFSINDFCIESDTDSENLNP